MAQGTPLRVPTPAGILLLDPLDQDAGGLLGTSQGAISRYGSIRLRDGIRVLGQDLPADQVVLGGFYVRDKAGNIQLVIGTNKAWWHFNNTTRLWEDISGGVPLTGSSIMPVTFCYYEQGDFQYILGCNGVDQSKEWQVGTAAYANIATGYIADSICTVANRVIYGAPTIGGIKFPTMVAWSSAGDRTSNPANARTVLRDSGDHIMAVRPSTRLAVSIFREQSIWTGQAVVSSDANAFQWSLAEEAPGPIGPMAIADDVGFKRTYLSQDLNIWEYDGVTPRIIAQTADYLRRRVNLAIAKAIQVVYDQGRQELNINLPLDGDAQPLHLLTYSRLTEGVFPSRWNQAYPVTAAINWYSELDTPTELLPDVPTEELPDVPTEFLGFIPGQSTIIVASNNVVYTADGVDDNGQAIPFVAEILMPTTPGVEYEFDGVEIMAVPTTATLAVSVKIGHTFDQLTEIPLGVIDPSLPAPTYPGPLEETPAGPNLCRVRSDQDLRARFVVVRLVSSSSAAFKIRRIELTSSGRKVMA